MKISVLSVAVQSALAAMIAMPVLAHAADATEADVAVTRQPSNYVEVGVGYVSEDSAKFGEYNGLDESGAVFIGNFSGRGGEGYDGGDGTLRWSIFGTDIGTSSREFVATVGSQGQWNLSIGYDELQHNITDTYETPFQGGMGGNEFTLPANFGSSIAQTAPSARTLTPTQLDAFRSPDVSTTRRK